MREVPTIIRITMVNRELWVNKAYTSKAVYVKIKKIKRKKLA